jgi:post-segregation antitoxin (ccd killing protein)
MGQKITVYVPDDLHARAVDELGASFNFSAALRHAIETELAEREECTHPVLRCARCAAQITGNAT